jgi:hypothetical protein
VAGRPREEVVVDVDHPPDDPLQVALNEHLVDGARQIRPEILLDDRLHRRQVTHDQDDLARHQLAVDQGEAIRPSVLST